ncbi:crotonase/enoyl-CoA hydratase family protein [Algiphilus sp.]|uniref:crotonase/enoyl-CoA hydratase family protein n=1 Tax=Algiphilus sp. TaxID=1872431 RepID=UPI0025BC50A8|nr:crotonase/enoyl-CoA hydratase family protein [Algiphilus sp.]MCK5770367.1 crotonase/enoyl-CoA hydratase family protein [Algiphilus sp.]
MSQRVRTDIEGDIARVTLTRAKAHNGVDQAMMDGVIAAAESLADEKSVRAVILSGEGPSFCAGIDVKAFFGKGMSLDLAKLYARLYSPMRNKFQQFSLAWRDLPIPVIAAVHGNCFGAGIQLALGADFRIVRPDAQLSVMEAKWGLVPDMGGAVLLRELVSADIARLLTYTGRVVSGEEARSLGLATQVADDPVAAAETLAREIAARSPDAVAAGKLLLNEAWHDTESGALAAERRRQRQLMGRANQRVSVARNTGKPDTPYKPRRITG